jgi:hypothetical protein
MSSVGSPARAFVAKSSNNFVEANITPFHDGADSNESIDTQGAWRLERTPRLIF